jgi:hypothetical protein
VLLLLLLLLSLCLVAPAARRERRQLTRTTADMFRLVPMVIILVRGRGGAVGGDVDDAATQLEGDASTCWHL